MLDSPAVFASRLREAGISDAIIDVLNRNNLKTMAGLAFLSSCQPGVGDETPFVNALQEALNYVDRSEFPPGMLGIFRRLWFEAHCVAVSEMRAKVEKTDQTAPRRMPIPERASRHLAQKTRLNGLIITTDLEPSHCLVDFVMAMLEDNTLRYVDPVKCTSRSQELLGVKSETVQKPDKQGFMRQQTVQMDEQADLSDGLKIRTALQRRSLALDISGLMTYEFSEEYHNFLFGLIQMTVPDAYKPIDTIQVLNADRIIYQRMLEHTREGIIVLGNGVRPLEVALTEARKHPLVTCALQPMARSSNSGKSTRAQKQADRGKPYQKGKATDGKGGKKGFKKGTGLPPSFAGLWTRSVEGHNICFDCNLAHGCNLPVTDGWCARGHHVCMGCHLPGHVLAQCQAIVRRPPPQGGKGKGGK